MEEPAKIKTIAIIPIHNEEKTIGLLVQEVKKYVSDVIVVDDSSEDKGGKIAEKYGALVFRHDINLGKAGALKTGCEAAVLLKADTIVLMDGDGQHLPKDIPTLINKINYDHYDLVIGARQESREAPFIRKYGNELLKFLVNKFFHVKVSDIQSGFRAFPAKNYLRYFCWTSHNYNADAEITVRAGKNNLRCTEIPIQTIYHDKYKGMTIIDGLYLLINLLIWKIT